MRKWTCALFVIFMGCSPSSMEDFHHEGKAITRAITAELRKIETREDLSFAEPRLKRRFEDLVTIMIEAREFQIKHAEELLGAQLLEDDVEGELLKEELQRVYQIEGGKESIERAQRESMLRLDAYEKNKAKLKVLRVK